MSVARNLDRAQRRLQAVAEPEPFYTVASLARRLAISDRTVRTMLNRGDLSSYRIGAQRRIDPDDVRRWLEQHREQR